MMALFLVACGGQAQQTDGQEPAPAGETSAADEEEAAAEEPTEAPEEEEPAPDAGEEEPAAEPVTVTYWHTLSDAEVEAMEEVVAMFEEAHPDVQIEMTRFAYDDFKSALLTGLAGDEGPDTARLDIIWVPEFAELGALVPLDEEMANFQSIADQTFPGPLSTNLWQGN
jgi:multiple sugar transport system substrate-binding protein